ncbi:MAG TPA: hypothetical protein VJX68_09705 [Candidatus Binatus sp.]|uniref:hypothetical protein n=1 Tax=Candidatus Binatus sp. TaxID=2811406 RepID=UPI002B4A92AF|nr:hypothetical protein [Candidatus Binatus sp.]HKN13455.1 hypothetical protein [Candidatus Binatus sp.]
MIDNTIKRLLAITVLAAATGLFGCASSDPNQTATAATTCQGQDQTDCEARDNARQIRDEADYQTEPALGYLNSPPGLLPIPLTSRNTSAN